MSTQWETPVEEQTWHTLTGMLTKLPAALDAQLTKDAGLTLFEFLVLSALSEAPDLTLRMSALASRTNGSLSRLSHVVRRLEMQGLVRRMGAPEDRRATNATLTGDGLRRLEAATPRHVEYARSVVIDIAAEEDLHALGRLGQRILDQLSDEHTSPTPAAAAS